MGDQSLDLIHEIIREGELEVEGRFVDASNATLFAHASRGEKSIPVIYKPIAGERPLWDFPDGTLANREVAAYRLSRELGLDLIPFTVLRNGPFGPGSVQQWIDVPDELDIVALVRSEPDQLRKLALFDAIANNTDRKFGHILQDKDGKYFGCDHGLCFHEEDKLRTVLWNWSGLPFRDDEISTLRQALVSVDILSDLLSADEIAALRDRIQELLSSGHFPEPSEDWPPVPFPPF
jgi:uncharacterized repeat protein (TIGR03843 family)